MRVGAVRSSGGWRSRRSSRLLREVRRAVSWHRRLLAAAFAAAAVALGLSAVVPEPPPTELVLAAATDLAGGATLRAGDLRELRLPPDAVPAGVLRPGTEVSGRTIAGPMRSGEPLTDVRLVGPSLLSGYGEGVVAAPVRIADAGAVRLLHAGDVVDVLAAETTLASDPEGRTASVRPARVIAAAARVLLVPAPQDSGDGSGASLSGDALVVFAVDRTVAADLARAAVTAQLSVTLRRS